MAGRMYLGNEMVTPAIVSGGVDSVNGQTGEVILTASDVGALPDTTKYAKTLGLSMNTTTYVLSWQLYDQNGDAIGAVQTVDLPLESVVVNGTYDSTNKKIILTLQNGSTIDVPVGDLVNGLQSEITITNKLSSDLVDDTNHTHKFVTAEEKTTWNNKQNAINDLDAIRSGASAGATAVQPSAIEDMQTTTNLVTSVSSSGTNTQYPSAKAVYNVKLDLEDQLDGEAGQRATADNTLLGKINVVSSDIKDKISSNFAVNDFATNCLLEISEDLKLELSNGTLTLKNGSVCTKTDGTQTTIESDKTITISTNGTYLIYCKTVNQLESIELSNVYSSTTAPTGSGKLLWLDITNIIFKESTDGGSSWTNDIFLPICVVTVSSGSISSINKTFNGLGFIGNSIYALPNIVCLFSDGRDENGNVKSIKYKNENVLFFLKDMDDYYSGSIYIGDNELFVTSAPTITDTPPTYGFYWYSPKINKMFYGRSGMTIIKKNLIVCGKANYGSALLNSFDIRTVSGMSGTHITTALGYTPYNSTNPSGYITGITSSDVISALGYTPYNSSNPDGYTSNVGTVISVNNVSPVNGNVTLSIPSEVTETTVSNWGFTKNTGTVTSVNNVSPVSGNVTLSIPSDTSDLTNGAGYITSSALSGYQTTANLVTSVSSSSTDTQYPSAKLFYDTCGDIETLINAL